MTKRVLIFFPGHAEWGGGHIYVEQLCAYLNRSGTEAQILTHRAELFGCPAVKLPSLRSKLKRALSSFAIARRYRKSGYDTIILSDLASLWLAPVFKLYGYRVISLLHIYLRKRQGRELGHSPLAYHLLRFSATFCDRIFSVNKNNVAVFGAERVTFIGNFVPDWFFAAPRTQTKPYDFVLIARFSVQKNIPLFLSLLKNLNDRSGNVYKALLVGRGPERGRIDRVIAELGLERAVTIMKWVERDALPSVYDLGKCFVISSFHEGFATTLLEAHARGVPAIVTESSGFCAEFVEGYNAPTGIVFNDESLKAAPFYDGLAALIAEYETYGETCMEKAKIFSEANVLGPIRDAVNEG